ncbi:peptidase MA family protein [Acinetobacter pittii]|uniref:peptidase MA family protein n=1 Tax=Acinetobacter pittii TaxID=48296 RepID=UPI0031F536E4
MFFMHKKTLVLLFSTFCASTYIHAKTDCYSSSPPVVKQLDQVYYSMNNLRIFYTTSGDNALTFQQDKNLNHIPDYVENIAIQANSIRKAWSVLGYQDPLNSPRYKNDVKYIDIQIQKLNGLGLAYDEPHRHINNPLKKNACALIILISNNIPNLTTNSSLIAHELFHLYTYGYTMFKQPWLTESLAAWSEGIIRKDKLGIYGQRNLPENEEDFEKYVLQRTYRTSQLWNRLTTLIDRSDGQLFLPLSLMQQKYTDGQPVFQDKYLKGTLFIRKFLENLGRQDQKISVLNNWNLYHWKEIDQNSAHFNEQILDTLLITLESMDERNIEKNKFKNLLKKVVKNKKTN